jgi:cytochrome c
MWLDDNDGAPFAWCLPETMMNKTKSLGLLAGAAFALGVAVAAGTSAFAQSSAVQSSAVQSPAGDPVRGHTVYARCIACHDLNTGVTRLGPSLKGVMGRKAGGVADFAYSAAMKGSGVTWDTASLDAFLKAPATFMKGSRMAFAGLPDAQDRADVIAYLQQSAH